MRIIENHPPERPSVSVVTPVCNTSAYLAECLDSLLNQTLTNIEMICINDGSSDDSLDILLEYQRRDNRIRVIDKPNSGYGATMNLGISLAHGTYIGILESDDFAEPEMFSTMYRFAKWHDCDLVKCSYFDHSMNGDVGVRPFEGYRYREVFDPRDDLSVLYQLPAIWAALYKRKMLTDNLVRFNETPGASYQDTSFVFQCWVASHRVALLPDCLLHYRIDNSGSSVKSSKKALAVCDEYALSDAFLKADFERGLPFRSIIHVIKLGTYRWNYNRLDDDGRAVFVQKMSEEYAAAEADGTLDRSLFSDDNWQIIQDVINRPESILEMYPEM